VWHAVGVRPWACMACCRCCVCTCVRAFACGVVCVCMHVASVCMSCMRGCVCAWHACCMSVHAREDQAGRRASAPYITVPSSAPCCYNYGPQCVGAIDHGAELCAVLLQLWTLVPRSVAPGCVTSALRFTAPSLGFIFEIFPKGMYL
jgi:hypothetical protein